MKIRTIGLAIALAVSMTMPSMAAVGDFANGVYLNYDNTAVQGALEKGISVSKYQNRAGKIDWNAVKNSGVSFVMVRIGYLDSFDPYFDVNMREAAEAGLKVGAYFYTQAKNLETVEKEADFVINALKGYDVSYPIAYDVESEDIKNLSKAQLTAQINTFCGRIKQAGYTPMIYGNSDWLVNNMNISEIPYDIWYARYGTGTGSEYANRTIWQCTDSGRVNGINGNVTLELAFKNYGPSIAPIVSGPSASVLEPVVGPGASIPVSDSNIIFAK